MHTLRKAGSGAVVYLRAPRMAERAQSGGEKPYPEVDPQPDFPALERAVLARWQREGTFRQSVDQRPGGDNEFVFYDGPPFANGLPHHGHLLTGYVRTSSPATRR